MMSRTFFLVIHWRKQKNLFVFVQKRLSKADAQYYTLNDALRLGFENKHVTRIIELSKEEAYGAFDMERETPVFEPRYEK